MPSWSVHRTSRPARRYRSFSVPVTDADRKARYFDLAVDLAIQADGTIGSTAAVTSAPSPKKVKSNLFVGGKYKDPSGATCDVEAGELLQTGRQETSVYCTASNYTWQATWQNGDIAGNTFSVQLIGAGINKINWQGYAWGLIVQTPGDYEGCIWTNGIVGARQDGKNIVMSYFGAQDYADCGLTLVPA